MNQMTRVAPMPAIDFSRPKGEEAYLAPDSIQWKVFKNPVALAVGGVAAVLLEFADARIRSGVWDHSIYKVDPIGRSQRTGMAAMVGVYGPKSVARQVIGGVNRMHAKVAGKTPRRIDVGSWRRGAGSRERGRTPAFLTTAGQGTTC